MEEESKTCRVAKAERRRAKYDPVKEAARGAVYRALLKGLIEREPCLVCDDENVQAHHHDYSLPLAVTWLCPRHHAMVHRDLTHRDRIVAAIKEWNDVVGRPPGATDWNRSSKAHRPRAETAYRSWPATSGVMNIFGSWNPGVRRDPEAWKASINLSIRNKKVDAREKNELRQKISDMWFAGDNARTIAKDVGLEYRSIWRQIASMRSDGWDLPKRPGGPRT